MLPWTACLELIWSDVILFEKIKRKLLWLEFERQHSAESVSILDEGFELMHNRNTMEYLIELKKIVSELFWNVF